MTQSQTPDEPRVAVVTGAGQGLGKAIAASLQDSGHRVALVDLDADAAKAAAHELDPSEQATMAVSADVGDREAFAHALDEVGARWRRVDVLVNNAAASVMRSFWAIEPEEWDHVLGVNLRSVFLGCQLAGPLMREGGWGRIINLSSIAGQQGGAVMGAHYAASKAGILVLTKIVAQELAGSGVTVNALAPAAIDSPLLQGLGDDAIESLADKIPVGRVGRPEEVGALAAFLASEDAGYITGATLDINGGLHMR
ncbi:SDR family oxidoreductase [Egibacter rhizosphaerae]|uniref:SDR family oxidoreductase n=1 Tax=Egibacter rhizosphaerae TaxID=1670831 RepID=A0A411YH68_9ACTN|nr:SDR family NAD(P)-dependent oxidoreductase [Egibacter rhizosphaerae]QBI20412.1 SDR family oxidoreductase [Egibacter rhizosphaerae]